MEMWSMATTPKQNYNSQVTALNAQLFSLNSTNMNAINLQLIQCTYIYRRVFNLRQNKSPFFSDYTLATWNVSANIIEIQLHM
jgi:hypothetical protein